MDITISETIGARVELHDWCAKSYPGEWTGPRTQAAREQVRRAVLCAVRRYGLTVQRVAVRYDGGLTVY